MLCSLAIRKASKVRLLSKYPWNRKAEVVRIVITRVLDKRCSLFEGDFLSDSKIFFFFKIDVDGVECMHDVSTFNRHLTGRSALEALTQKSDQQYQPYTEPQAQALIQKVRLFATRTAIDNCANVRVYNINKNMIINCANVRVYR